MDEDISSAADAAPCVSSFTFSTALDTCLAFGGLLFGGRRNALAHLADVSKRARRAPSPPPTCCAHGFGE